MATNNKNNSGRTSNKRGFAAMDKETQHEIAAKGGRASHGGRSNNISSRRDDSDE